MADTVTPRVHWTSCLVLFLLAWAFWAFVHPEALSYQEETQLFMFDKQYFADRAFKGLSVIIGEFLIQFFNNVMIGAAIIAALYVLNVCLCWLILKSTGSRTYKKYIWGYVFVLLLWIWMALTNVRFTDIVAITNLLLISIVVGSRPFVKPDGKRKWWAYVVFVVLLTVFGFGGKDSGFYECANWNLQKYDYLARQQNWEGIMERGKDDDTNDPVCNAYINLAYGMKGALSTRGEEHVRRGLENAFPKEDGAFITDAALSDVYYYLGLTCTSREYADKANKNLRKGSLSARMVKRIIETDIINGNYDDARTYLNKMQKTIFYSQWAAKNLALLGNEDAINNHPFYGYERRVRLPQDVITDRVKMDNVILSLINHNSENYLAVQYYMLIPQLEHNDQKYVKYLKYVEKKMK